MPDASHEFLEHAAETILRVTAPTPAELYAEAGRGLTALQLRGRPLPPAGEEREVALESADAGALLVDWLNELIFLAELEGFVPDRIVVSAAERSLRARLRGGRLAEPPSFVKAATMHGVRLERSGAGWQAEVILDV